MDIDVGDPEYIDQKPDATNSPITIRVYREKGPCNDCGHSIDPTEIEVASHKKDLFSKPVECPECGGETRFSSSHNAHDTMLPETDPRIVFISGEVDV